MRRIEATNRPEDVGRTSAGRGGDDETLIHTTEEGIRTGGRAKPLSKI